jgi:hypothetical protein
MQNLKTDKRIITNKDKFPDRFMQPDSAAFHRLISLKQILTDKKENKIFPRFAFLKISCKRTLHTFAFAPPHKANPSQKQKSAILPTHKCSFLKVCLHSPDSHSIFVK